MGYRTEIFFFFFFLEIQKLTYGKLRACRAHVSHFLGAIDNKLALMVWSGINANKCLDNNANIQETTAGWFHIQVTLDHSKFKGP
jgi:hypothetical protein